LIEVKDGMVVSTKSEKVLEIRKRNILKIMNNHALDCFSCKKSGNCRLQKYAAMFDWDDIDEFSGKYTEDRYVPIYRGILFNESKCIKCNRCVVFLKETCGITIEKVDLLQSVQTDVDIVGTIVDLCPTAATMNNCKVNKLSKFNMHQTETIDVSDIFMPTLTVLQDCEKIIAVMSKNSKWIKDETRFTYNIINKRPITEGVVYDQAINMLANNINDKRPEKTVFVIGDNIDVESFLLLNYIANKKPNCCVVFGCLEKRIIDAMGLPLKRVAKTDAVVFIGQPKLSETLHILNLLPPLKEKFFVDDINKNPDIVLSKFQNPVIIISRPNNASVEYAEAYFGKYPIIVLPGTPSQMLGKYIDRFWTVNSFKQEFNKHEVKIMYIAGRIEKKIDLGSVFSIYHSWQNNHANYSIYLTDKHFFESQLQYVNAFGKVAKSSSIRCQEDIVSVNDFSNRLFKLVFQDRYKEKFAEIKNALATIVN
jgi:hypothetical protein